MALSNDIISQFAKLTTTKKPTNSERTVYGTIVERDGSKYVKLDGSDLLTPVASTTNIESDERVTVMIKNHTATITGNLSSPAARSSEVSEIGSQISVFETIIADKVDTIQLVAVEAQIEDLEAKNVVIEDTLIAAQASIKELETTKLSAETADIKYANIDFTNIGKAAMEYFYAESGLIRNVVVDNQTITGNLVGVTISGDLIEGNTVVAEKLVIKGEDGLYYKLNTDGMNIETQQTDYNSLNGSIIKAKSITATKISVSDLVAFDATIGGFNITEDSIYSGVKESVDNTTDGVYLDKTGQIAFGNSTDYVKFYRKEDGTYELAISASTLVFGSSKKTVEEVINSETNKTYVSPIEPVGTFNVGDTWYQTSISDSIQTASSVATWELTLGSSDSATWASLADMTWDEAALYQWSGDVSNAVKVYTWNGNEWILVSDIAGALEDYPTIAEMTSAIGLSAESLTTEFNKKISGYSTTEEMNSAIDQSAESIKSVVYEKTEVDDKLKGYSTTEEMNSAIDQSAKSIVLEVEKMTPDSLENSSVTIDSSGIDMDGGEINLRAGSAMKIESGGTFEIESENFTVTPEGRVSMLDAVVSGNLSQDGYSVLTQKNLVISSSEPTGSENMVWVKPLSNVTLTYTHGIAAQTNFKAFNTAQKLVLQGDPMDATATTYRYTLRIPYAVTGTPSETRTVTATIISNSGRTIGMTGTLINTLGYTGTLELTTTADFWVGDSDTVSLTLTVEAPATSYDYEYHKITPGTIQLICTAKSSNVSGWTNAEVYVYQ